MHLLLSVALSFTHTRRLMTTLALTKDKPRYMSLFKGLFTYTEYHEGAQKKRHFQFGTGENGTPAELEVNWAQPDAFKTRYSEKQWNEAVIVEGKENEFVDEDGEITQARLMHDGFTVPAHIVASVSKAGESNWKSLRGTKPNTKPA